MTAGSSLLLTLLQLLLLPRTTAAARQLQFSPTGCDGVPDLNGDGLVSVPDLLGVLASYGCAGSACCAGCDTNGDGRTDVTDILVVLSWYNVRCGCASGWELRNGQCGEVNPCAGFETDDCDYQALCTHTGPGSHTCACLAGYSGSGIRDSCFDTDGCAAAPCFAEVSCEDVAAPNTGRTCGACPSGYAGDGATCADIDDCAAVPCGGHGICSDTGPSAYACNCDSGFLFQGGTCTAISPCSANETNDCSSNAACSHDVAAADGYNCVCNFGFIGNGQACVEGTDCVGDWSAWEGCSVLCGNGTRIRTFEVSVAATLAGWCARENTFQSDSCNMQACPIDCTGVSLQRLFCVRLPLHFMHSSSIPEQ